MVRAGFGHEVLIHFAHKYSRPRLGCPLDKPVPFKSARTTSSCRTPAHKYKMPHCYVRHFVFVRRAGFEPA